MSNPSSPSFNGFRKKTMLVRIGALTALIFDQQVTKALGLSENELLELTVSKDGILIKKAGGEENGSH